MFNLLPLELCQAIADYLPLSSFGQYAQVNSQCNSLKPTLNQVFPPKLDLLFFAQMIMKADVSKHTWYSWDYDKLRIGHIYGTQKTAIMIKINEDLYQTIIDAQSLVKYLMQNWEMLDKFITPRFLYDLLLQQPWIAKYEIRECCLRLMSSLAPYLTEPHKFAFELIDNTLKYTSRNRLFGPQLKWSLEQVCDSKFANKDDNWYRASDDYNFFLEKFNSMNRFHYEKNSDTLETNPYIYVTYSNLSALLDLLNSLNPTDLKNSDYWGDHRNDDSDNEKIELED